MKNLLLLGILFLSAAVFAQNTEEPEAPEIIIESLVGSVEGFNVRNGDDKIDFGLVIPTLTKTQVMDFNLSYVLSSETAVIRAAGQRINVPSNLSLPMQSERYIFFNVRIDKPEFKLPITTAETPREVVVLEGRFPFADTVDTLRAGNPLFAVVNSFDFKSYSIFSVDAPEAPLDLSVGENPIEGEQVEFVNPLTEDDEFVSLGLSMASTVGEDGLLRHFPIDVKTLERPELLRTDLASDTTPIVVSIPKDVFESATDASTKPFPFTMVWGDSAPTASLPLAKTFVNLNLEDPTTSVTIDFDKIISTLPIALKFSLIDGQGNETARLFTTEDLESEVTIAFGHTADEGDRVRVDVYAIDIDPVKASIIVENAFTEDDIIGEAKYISRYEEDLK